MFLFHVFFSFSLLKPCWIIYLQLPECAEEHFKSLLKKLLYPSGCCWHVQYFFFLPFPDLTTCSTPTLQRSLRHISLFIIYPSLHSQSIQLGCKLSRRWVCLAESRNAKSACRVFYFISTHDQLGKWGASSAQATVTRERGAEAEGKKKTCQGVKQMQDKRFICLNQCRNPLEIYSLKHIGRCLDSVCQMQWSEINNLTLKHYILVVAVIFYVFVKAFSTAHNTTHKANPLLWFFDYSQNIPDNLHL